MKSTPISPKGKEEAASAKRKIHHEHTQPGNCPLLSLSCFSSPPTLVKDDPCLGPSSLHPPLLSLSVSTEVTDNGSGNGNDTDSDIVHPGQIFRAVHPLFRSLHLPLPRTLPVCECHRVNYSTYPRPKPGRLGYMG